MSQVIVDLPERVQQRITALAAMHGFSLQQFIATAAMEKLAALRSVDYLRGEAEQGKREDFDRFLAAVPEREPDEFDRLPDPT